MFVYCSGPMSGIPDLNRTAFESAAKSLRASGHEVVSPIEMDDADGVPNEPIPVGGPMWRSLIYRDLKALLTCDAIHTLPGWRKSRGARLEVFVAMELGLKYVDAQGNPLPEPECKLIPPEE